MTGRDIIVYILTHNLEDVDMIAFVYDGEEDDRLVDFISEEEAAVKFDVGVATVRAWADMKLIEAVRINGTIFVSEDAERPAAMSNK